MYAYGYHAYRQDDTIINSIGGVEEQTDRKR